MKPAQLRLATRVHADADRRVRPASPYRFTMSRRSEVVRVGRWDLAVGVCARTGGEAKLGRLRGPRARVGGQVGWLARQSRSGLLLLPILSFLFFYSFSILFSFLFYLLPICLGFDLFSLIIIVTIPSFWFGQEFRAYMWSPHT